MSETKISNRYADALIQLAVSENKLDAISENMSTLATTISESKDLQNALKNPVINKEQKLNALLGIYFKFDPLVLNFFRLVSSKNREDLLPEIADSFMNLYRTMKKIEKVEVKTAVPLSSQDEQSIRQYIKQKTGANEIELHTKIDPSVIGGLVIRFGDNLLDTSIAAKLRKLKKELNIA